MQITILHAMTINNSASVWRYVGWWVQRVQGTACSRIEPDGVWLQNPQIWWVSLTLCALYKFTYLPSEARYTLLESAADKCTPPHVGPTSTPPKLFESLLILPRTTVAETYPHHTALGQSGQYKSETVACKNCHRWDGFCHRTTSDQCQCQSTFNCHWHG